MGNHPDPLSSGSQPVSGRTLVLACLAVLAMGAGSVAIWYFGIRTDSRPPSGDSGIVIGPRVRNEEQVRARQDSLEHMKLVAQALVDYRDRLGGGLRWPGELGELSAMGLLATDFDFRGPLSGQPLAYQPDLPLGQRSEVWVMVADILIEEPRRDFRLDASRRVVGRDYRGDNPRMVAATVILADGSVKVLEPADFNQYAGLDNAARMFDRPAR